MVTAPLSSVVQKRDLHFGGLGNDAAVALAAVTDRIPEVVEPWKLWAQSTAREADRFLRKNPWTALAVVAAAGVTAGYLLAQQHRPRGFRLPRLRR